MSEKEKERLRPVLVFDPQKPDERLKAWFHAWGTTGDSINFEPCGVVEFEDGTCAWYFVEWIQFTDRA